VNHELKTPSGLEQEGFSSIAIALQFSARPDAKPLSTFADALLVSPNLCPEQVLDRECGRNWMAAPARLFRKDPQSMIVDPTIARVPMWTSQDPGAHAQKQPDDPKCASHVAVSITAKLINEGAG
jgi:hypothetical protein